MLKEGKIKRGCFGITKEETPTLHSLALERKQKAAGT